VLTQGGHRILATWMAGAGHPVDAALVDRLTAEVAALTPA
jgi:para-aminobenzoate synthetase component 2